MPASPAEQTYAAYADAIEAIDLTKRAALQAARSWVGGVKAALPQPAVQPDPWALIDIGFDSADLYVTAQTWYARTLLDGVAEATEAFGSGRTVASPPPPALPATVAAAAGPAAPAARAPKAATARTPAATAKAGSRAKRPAPRKRPTA